MPAKRPSAPASDPLGDDSDIEHSEPAPIIEAEPVGYGKPPRQHQFQKGRSGNPKGRPKGSKNFDTLLQELLDHKITAKIDGAPRRVSQREAVARQFVQMALKGNLKAINDLIAQDKADADASGGIASAPTLNADDEALLARFMETLDLEKLS